MYGEDGMDISKSQFLNGKHMEFLSENVKVLKQTEHLEQLKNDESHSLVKAHVEKVSLFFYILILVPTVLINLRLVNGKMNLVTHWRREGKVRFHYSPNM